MKILSKIFIVLAILTVIYGRYKTIDYTEGRALINGFVYWTTSIIFGIVGFYIDYIYENNNDE